MTLSLTSATLSLTNGASLLPQPLCPSHGHRLSDRRQAALGRCAACESCQVRTPHREGNCTLLFDSCGTVPSAARQTWGPSVDWQLERYQWARWRHEAGQRFEDQTCQVNDGAVLTHLAVQVPRQIQTLVTRYERCLPGVLARDRWSAILGLRLVMRAATEVAIAEEQRDSATHQIAWVYAVQPACAL